MLSLKLMVAAVFRITTASARVTAAELYNTFNPPSPPAQAENPPLATSPATGAQTCLSVATTVAEPGRRSPRRWRHCRGARQSLAPVGAPRRRGLATVAREVAIKSVFEND